MNETLHPRGTPQQAPKSNIYVFVELANIIQRMEMDRAMTNQTLAQHVVYFHLINPKHLSAPLARDWLAILDFVGFDSPVKFSTTEIKKAQIWKKVGHLMPSDTKKLMTMLHRLMARLDAELK